MKEIYSFLNNIPISKRWIFISILLSIAVFPTLINLLFLSDSLRTLLNNNFYFVIMSLVVFSAWLTLFYFLLSKDHVQLEHLSLRKAQIAKGAYLGFLIFIIVNVVLLIKAVVMGEGVTLAAKLSSIEGAIKVVGVFTLNIFISAFVEELLCRAYIVPQAYLLLCQKLRYKSVALLFSLIATQLLFALAHLPRDLFRFSIDTVPTIISTQSQLFMSGIILSLVYLRTRNIIFVSILHAFMNYGLPVTGTDADFKLYYMVAAFTVTIFWHRITGTERLSNPIAPRVA